MISFRVRVLQVVRSIPAGRVATYGQVAALAGSPGAARACGSILRGTLEEPSLPWHRVINAQGAISSGGDLVRPLLQRSLLESEGVILTRRGRCDLRRFQWRPNDAQIKGFVLEDVEPGDG